MNHAEFETLIIYIYILVMMRLFGSLGKYRETGGIGKETNCDEQRLDLEIDEEVYSLQ